MCFRPKYICIYGTETHMMKMRHASPNACFRNTALNLTSGGIHNDAAHVQDIRRFHLRNARRTFVIPIVRTRLQQQRRKTHIDNDATHVQNLLCFPCGMLVVPSSYLRHTFVIPSSYPLKLRHTFVIPPPIWRGVPCSYPEIEND